MKNLKQRKESNIDLMAFSFNVKLACSWVYAPALAKAFDYGSTGPAVLEKKHIINIYHDTTTGVRMASLDFKEIENSAGSSTVVMGSTPHRISFFINGRAAYIEIKKVGALRFSYHCVVDNAVLLASSSRILPHEERAFMASISDVVFLPDEKSEKHIAWYNVQTMRVLDSVSTSVLRFRCFVLF